MKQRHSTKWKASSQRRKQRKFRANAPLHIKRKFLSVHLIKDLREKHKTRTAIVRVGDKVRVLRGSFKGREQKVERIDTKESKVYVTKVEVVKKDGATKVPVALNPSNLVIVELDTTDKKRMIK